MRIIRLFLCFLLLPINLLADGSLNMGANLTDKVSLGTGIPTYTQITHMTWFKASTLAAFNMLFAREGASASQEAPSLCLGPGANSNQLRLKWQASSQLIMICNNANMGTGMWYYGAFTVDQSASPQAHIYIGQSTSTAVECTYGTNATGSGFTSNAGKETQIGNLPRDTLPWQGSIGFAQTLTDVSQPLLVQECQWMECYSPNTVTQMNLGWNGTGTQFNLAGNGNDGIVTGATGNIDSPPLNFYGAN